MTDWLTRKIDSTDNPAAPTTPTRAIGTSFQPSTTKYVLGAYTVQQVATHGQDGTVTLFSDAADPPTTARAEARLAVADDATGVTTMSQLSYLVPPGHFVKLVAAGTGTNTVPVQVETAIS